MYFSKKFSSYRKVSTPNLTTNSKQDFADYFKIFNFKEHIYRDKREYFSKIFNENRAFLPDVAASVIAGLAISNSLTDSLFQKGLECCRDILLDIGYHENHIDTLRTNVAHDKDRIIAIPGCQDEKMLRRRCECAAKVFKGLNNHVRFVAIGSHPGREKAKIQNEALRIKTKLGNILKEYTDITIIPVEIEQESMTSEQNIKKLFFGKDLIDQKRATSVFIISSIFHLIRLAMYMEKYLPHLHKGKKVPELNYIVLVGSEEPDGVIPMEVKRGRYARNLFYDIYYYLLTKIIE